LSGNVTDVVGGKERDRCGLFFGRRRRDIGVISICI